LREEEFFIFQQLDGAADFADIQAAFQDKFAPRRLSLRRLEGFLAMLHRENLIVSDRTGQGEQLRRRRDQQRRRARLATVSNPLAIRFRGFNPDPLLSWLEPQCRWLFTPWAAAMAVLLIGSALTLLLVQFETLQSRLPDFQAFFSVDQLLWFGLAIAVAKILHELGHGLTCRHLGGSCHELGVLLLVFTPCLYVNVSDSWLMPNKWHRIAIAAAGMVVEAVLASVCTLLWWFSAPGLFNSICLQLMFVCSISTLVFNGNPLLRYDGYFILSDLIEIPNLRETSVGLVRRYLARLLLGIELGSQRMYEVAPRGRLILYAVLSTVYRWIVVLGILWFCHQVLEPYGMQLLAQLLTVLVVGGMLVVPLYRLIAFVAAPHRRRQVKWFRFVLAVAIFGVLAYVLLTWPLPYRITAPIV
jgi:putative peptide zinc metalloprotease protein